MSAHHAPAADSSSSSTASLPSVDKNVTVVKEIEDAPARPNKTRKVLLFAVIPAIVLVVLALGLGLGLGLGLKRKIAEADDAPTSSSSSSPPTIPSGSGTSNNNNATGTVRTWDYPIGYDFNLAKPDSKIQFYTVDLFNTTANTIKSLTAAGHFVACYFSAGSIEDWRPDAVDFPPSTIGKDLQGWRGEKWIQVTNKAVVSVMSARISMAREKGCQGIDADNVDGFSNDTGFDISEADSVTFIRTLADFAKQNGMKFGLKNAGKIVPQVVDVSDWVVQEQCSQFGECAQYKPFIDAGKPVYHVEYTKDEGATTVDTATLDKMCASSGVVGISTIVKHLKLDPWILPCP